VQGRKHSPEEENLQRHKVDRGVIMLHCQDPPGVGNHPELG